MEKLVYLGDLFSGQIKMVSTIKKKKIGKGSVLNVTGKKTGNEYRQCRRCVLDSTASEFYETPDGCYFCDLALRHKPTGKMPPLSSKHPKYDVLLGLSGGVDSSYCLHMLKKLGVRVLTFSVDNGYNDPKADENIMKLVEGMKVPFYRYVIDLDKYKELQAAYLMSGLKNLEVTTDHILMAAAYELADEYGIKTIISGGNWVTESIMPESWGYQPRDLKQIKAVYKKFMHKKLTGLPMCSLWQYNWYKWVKKIRTVNMLDYVTYNRQHAIKVLERNYGFKDYHEKHCENTWTWWFQNYYLFEKFGIDKRKAHLSSLILSEQMTRDEAQAILETNPIYPKLGIEKKALSYPKHEYTDYPNDERLWKFLCKVVRFIRHANPQRLFNFGA